MNLRRENFALLLTTGILLSSIVAQVRAATLDRDYLMGDDAAEGAVNGGSVTTTFDSAGAFGPGQLVDLTAVNTPTYTPISGRPDGVGGRGIQFNAAQSEYLHGFSLGFPEDSFSAATHTTLSGGNLDYLGISNRGLQFWARPASTAVQTLVMDTNQHGVQINADGRFSMRYAGVDYEDTTQVVSPNTWYHIEVVRPAGAASGLGCTSTASPSRRLPADTTTTGQTLSSAPIRPETTVATTPKFLLPSASPAALRNSTAASSTT